MSTQRHQLYVTTLALLGLVAVGTAGCASSQMHDSKSQASVTFPDPGDAWQEQGSYPNMDNLRTLREGMSKEQVYGLLGRPHFDEGMFGEHEWNFLFYLPDGNGSYRVCQYQLHYDDDMLVDGRYWRSGECANLLAEEAPAATEMTLKTDALFDFDSATLSPRGEREIDRLVSRIDHGVSAMSISIVGHTDRLGSAEYNQTLSDRRAMAVRMAMIRRGISEKSISSWGVGESDPAKQCNETLSLAEQKTCLAPNRRVEVEITGETSNTDE